MDPRPLLDFQGIPSGSNPVFRESENRGSGRTTCSFPKKEFFALFRGNSNLARTAKFKSFLVKNFFPG